MTTALPWREEVPADPIFVVGSPRSGTSLLRVMLNRHPAMHLCDETYYFYYVYCRRKKFGDLSDPDVRRRVVDRYLATDRVRRLGLNSDALGAALISQGYSYPSFFAALMRFCAEANGKRRYGEKTPQHAVFSETLCEWYPRCRLIHLVRDPRDVVVSLMRMPWGSRSVLANTRTWVRCNQGAAQCSNRDNYLLVHYEQLVEQPESEMKRICTFLGEEYAPEMLVADDETKTDKWWFRRAQLSLRQDRREVWRAQLSSLQTELIEWIAGSEMRRYGYVAAAGDASLPARALGLAGEFLCAFRDKLVTLPHLWYFWVRPTQLASEEMWIDRRAAKAKEKEV